MRILLPDMVNRCFVTVDQDSDEGMLYDENVFLAEDRILCMGIHKRGYQLAYLPDAYAWVDPVKTVHELMGQRKRWINGTYFGFEKVKMELSVHESRTDSCQVLLNLQMLYITVMNWLSYSAPAMFLFSLHITMDAFFGLYSTSIPA
jgi:chitin synthase